MAGHKYLRKIEKIGAPTPDLASITQRLPLVCSASRQRRPRIGPQFERHAAATETNPDPHWPYFSLVGCEISGAARGSLNLKWFASLAAASHHPDLSRIYPSQIPQRLNLLAEGNYPRWGVDCPNEN